MYITPEVNLSRVVWYDDSIVVHIYTAACSALACVASYSLFAHAFNHDDIPSFLCTFVHVCTRSCQVTS